MNFLVIVTCAAGIACPIKGTIQETMIGPSSVEECQRTVAGMISSVAQIRVNDLKIVCKPK